MISDSHQTDKHVGLPLPELHSPSIAHDSTKLGSGQVSSFVF